MQSVLNTLAAAAGTPTGTWFTQLVMGTNEKMAVAHAVLVLALVVATGLFLGTLRLFGISLGIAGVLFAGIAFGHFGLKIDHHTLEFVREFGLILFVYTIGLQVGPGFLGSLRRAGLPLNLMAASVVLLGVATTLGIIFVSKQMGRPVPVPVAMGLLSGAVTNTPGLGAGQAAISEVNAAGGEPAKAAGTQPTVATRVATAPEEKVEALATTQDDKGPATQAAVALAKSNSAVPPAGSLSREQATKVPGMAYAMAYPFGIIGIIFTMLLVRKLFRVDLAVEAKGFSESQGSSRHVKTINLEVTNPNLDGKQIGSVPMLCEEGVVISRLLRGGAGAAAAVATPDTELRLKDILHAVGPAEALERLKLLVGTESAIDVKAVPSDITTRRLVVTQGKVIGKSLDELDIEERFEVVITRVSRAEIEITATPAWRLQFGDVILAVGKAADINKLRTEVGDSVKKLDHPHMIPVFLGIALGVLVGQIPLSIPGMPAPVRLGLAGGPLLVAIILARVGQIGSLTWYMPRSANMALREFGIVLFLACVGIYSGADFVTTLTRGDGLYWMGCAALITILPLLIVGFVARAVFKVNYMNLCGLLAGSMTDPPALAFANQMTNGENPAVAYATVYPLTMMLRVVTAQAIVLMFYRPWG